MSSRIAGRLFSPTFRAAARQQQRVGARRGMSSAPHAAKSTSDTTWILVSSAVFIPTIGYLLSPAARTTQHKVHAATGHGEPKVPAEEVASSDSTPPAPVTDDEGTAVPASEVASSVSKAVNEGSPKDAAQAEAAGLPEAADTSRFNDGAPGQTGESEGDHEQSEKPHEEPKKGTLQSEEDEGARPTDLGAAREQSKQAGSPKKAAETK